MQNKELSGESFKSCLFSRKLNDLVMEKGGQPIRNVIFTTWRSGSTFLGETLDSHPGTFYHYEPLLHFEIKQVHKCLEKLPIITSKALYVRRFFLNYHVCGRFDRVSWQRRDSEC